MKIVMEKNRTRREIREELREVYEQLAEASADALMFDFEAENLSVEDKLYMTTRYVILALKPE